ncbi:hypothetical protein EVB91_159 [Rhizobium phage RHph_I1_18]|nr:hypothetical protein EVB91_159 [Rhizobium phage RHph_I1_18]
MSEHSAFLKSIGFTGPYFLDVQFFRGSPLVNQAENACKIEDFVSGQTAISSVHLARPLNLRAALLEISNKIGMPVEYNGRMFDGKLEEVSPISFKAVAHL